MPAQVACTLKGEGNHAVVIGIQASLQLSQFVGYMQKPLDPML